MAKNENLITLGIMLFSLAVGFIVAVVIGPFLILMAGLAIAYFVYSIIGGLFGLRPIFGEGGLFGR